ncbi:hypothetical protein ACTXT7_009503 [Hymenolepis weldensis]
MSRCRSLDVMMDIRLAKKSDTRSPTSDPTTVDTANWTIDFDSDEESKISHHNDAPQPKSSSKQDDQWRTHPISVFADKYRGENPEDRKLPSKVRHLFKIELVVNDDKYGKFYKKQDKLIESLQSTVSLLRDHNESVVDRNQAARRQQRFNNALIKATFFLNLTLFICKMTASILSHSLSVISSLMDSAVDLASGFTLWIAAHQMQKSLPYSYPTGMKSRHRYFTGRKRLEPIAVIILAVIMASLSVQIMVEAVQTIYNMAVNEQGPPVMDNLTIGLVSITIRKSFPTPILEVEWHYGDSNSATLYIS